jgi:hypothetical protein
MSNQPVFWKMRNGRLISVDDMDINHLRNVLKMIIRRHKEKEKQFVSKPSLSDLKAEYDAEDYGCR